MRILEATMEIKITRTDINQSINKKNRATFLTELLTSGGVLKTTNLYMDASIPAHTRTSASCVLLLKPSLAHL